MAYNFENKKDPLKCKGFVCHSLLACEVPCASLYNINEICAYFHYKHVNVGLGLFHVEPVSFQLSIAFGFFLVMLDLIS